MILQNLLESLIYLVSSYVLFVIGKLIYDWTTPSYRIREELVEKDNVAFAIAFVGYLFGLILAIGGVLAGPSQGLEQDLIDIGIFGGLAIVLLNLSRVINDKLILHSFSIRDEVVRDQNMGTGAVVCASYVATGLVLYGAGSGVLGGVITVVVFWALGQIALVIAGQVYNWITPFDIHVEIEKDNVAAGVAFAGALIGIGNIVRHAVEGDFISWPMELQSFAVTVVVGIILLPIIRVGADLVILPGAKLSDEIAGEKPNLAAGFVEAFAYVGGSFLLVWAL